MKRLFAWLTRAFRCRHNEISWPHTDPKTGETTVVCLICNRRLEYSWSKMRIRVMENPNT
jgi:transcription elongation factor Elf1